MKKEMKEGTKEEKKKGKIPELYLDIQRRRTADERRVLAEAELCLLTHIEYQKAVAEWNRYVTEVTPWAALFQKLAGPLMIFAAAAREGQEQAARYAGQIQQAEERLRQILKTQLPGKQDASLPEVKRELETAEEFHLSQLTRPELSFEELEILVSLAERGSRTRGKQEELHQMISRQRQEQKQNLLYLREKREFFRSTSEHLNRKRKDRESHLVFMEAARQIIPAVQKMEQMNGGDLENARILAAFCQVQFLSGSDVPVFGVVEQQIFDMKLLCQLTGIFDRRMMLFIRVKNISLGIKAECFMEKPGAVKGIASA